MHFGNAIRNQTAQRQKIVPLIHGQNSGGHFRRSQRNCKIGISRVHCLGVPLELSDQRGDGVEIPGIHDDVCTAASGNGIVLGSGVDSGKLIGRFYGLQQPKQQLRGIGAPGTDIISGMTAQKPGDRQGDGMVQHGKKAIRCTAEGLSATACTGNHQFTKVKAVEIDQGRAARKTVCRKLLCAREPPLFIRENQPKGDMRTVCFQQIHGGRKTNAAVRAQRAPTIGAEEAVFPAGVNGVTFRRIV